MTDIDKRVVVVSDGKTWSECLSEIGDHDFFHTFDFHKATEAAGEGLPTAFAVYYKHVLVAFWPLLRRAIGNSERHDYSSVYGYGGPLFRPESDADNSLEAMINAMTRAGGVSLFSRMHPIFVSSLVKEESKGLFQGDVVAIKVNSSDMPPQNYRGDHRRKIRQLEENGYSVEVRCDREAVDLFISIYESQMDVLGASKYYYFTRPYYDAMLSSKQFEANILIARKDGAAAAAGMFVRTGGIMQYFLSGTSSAYRTDAPMKLLIAHAHRLSIDSGVSILILGGGLGAKRDSLFKFKEGFSKTLYPYYVLRKVLDQVAYNSLARARSVDPETSGFFPAYRSLK